MEIAFPAEIEAQVREAASRQGRDGQSIVVEAVSRWIDYDRWFVGEVQRGLDAAERGEFVEHESVGSMINSRYSV